MDSEILGRCTVNADVAVILTVWRRDNLREQLLAIMAQTVQPKEIWVCQNENFIDVRAILSEFPGVEHVHSSVNLKYFGRFSIARHLKAKFIWILDDDQIPSPNWLKTCLMICEAENAIVSSAGRIIPENDYLPERSNNIGKFFFGDVPQTGNSNTCAEDSIVDYGCNGWFLQQQWLRYFWETSPFTLEISEDMHLSALCKIRAGIRTIVPMQTSPINSGNLKIEYGRDEHASWTKPGFLEKRKEVLHYLIDELGWRPTMWKQAHTTKSGEATKDARFNLRLPIISRIFSLKKKLV
ncbi:glycosyltransferase [Dyadobacter sp. 676]|uniref:Glycosyltransferase n=1 Tax=Dyadobacter sp. 676 TaxID=3088362 RepID=A0AAU8FLZ2_9BACT